jgi:hypothetical protein
MVNVYSASGGIFELLLDGVVISSATAPVTVTGQSSHGWLFGGVLVQQSGNHTLAVRITRNIPAGEEVFQYLDNIVMIPMCYANCDGGTGLPLVTANDFQCFLNEFASLSAYANCDGSTGAPALTANDFQCFLNKAAAGCT